MRNRQFIAFLLALLIALNSWASEDVFEPSQNNTSATEPNACRLSDGASFYSLAGISTSINQGTLHQDNLTLFSNLGVSLAGIKADVDKIPSDPAREGGHLAAVDTSTAATSSSISGIGASLDSIKTAVQQIPSDPAREGGHLSTVDTSTASAASALSGIGPSLNSIRTSVSQIPSDPAKESGHLASIDTSTSTENNNTSGMGVSLNAIKTAVERIPVSPATETGHLATIDTSGTATSSSLAGIGASLNSIATAVAHLTDGTQTLMSAIGASTSPTVTHGAYVAPRLLPNGLLAVGEEDSAVQDWSKGRTIIFMDNLALSGTGINQVGLIYGNTGGCRVRWISYGAGATGSVTFGGKASPAVITSRGTQFVSLPGQKVGDTGTGNCQYFNGSINVSGSSLSQFLSLSVAANTATNVNSDRKSYHFLVPKGQYFLFTLQSSAAGNTGFLEVVTEDAN